jgi:uncharacterized protein DUF1918
MAKAGDRVIVDGTKVGSGRREGRVLDVVGRMIRVRWDGGEESMIMPAPGSVRFTSSAGAASSAPRPAARRAKPKSPQRTAKPAARKAGKKR